jgi:hypothetical protein
VYINVIIYLSSASRASFNSAVVSQTLLLVLKSREQRRLRLAEQKALVEVCKDFLFELNIYCYARVPKYDLKTTRTAASLILVAGLARLLVGKLRHVVVLTPQFH